jgi:hypothetical protein
LSESQENPGRLIDEVERLSRNLAENPKSLEGLGQAEREELLGELRRLEESLVKGESEEEGDLTEEQREKLDIFTSVLSTGAVGAALGAGSGLLLGPILGSLLLPGVGTIAGGLVGAAIGSRWKSSGRQAGSNE